MAQQTRRGWNRTAAREAFRSGPVVQEASASTYRAPQTVGGMVAVYEAARNRAMSEWIVDSAEEGRPMPVKAFAQPTGSLRAPVSTRKAYDQLREEAITRAAQANQALVAQVLAARAAAANTQRTAQTA